MIWCCNITVAEPLDRYTAPKPDMRYNTKVGYGFVLKAVRKEPFR